jgi:hypothetical protein
MTENYLMTTKNIDVFFNALINAAPPTKFIQKFLEQLEFKSTNDRLFIGVLRGLKFIDEAGVPLERYFKFIDQTQSKKVLAESIKDSYSDLFAINKKANEWSVADVKNKLKTIYQGQKSETVLDLMAKTFRGLCDYADWTETSSKKEEPVNKGKLRPRQKRKKKTNTKDSKHQSCITIFKFICQSQETQRYMMQSLKV